MTLDAVTPLPVSTGIPRRIKIRRKRLPIVGRIDYNMLQIEAI